MMSQLSCFEPIRSVDVAIQLHGENSERKKLGEFSNYGEKILDTRFERLEKFELLICGFL